MCEMAIQITSLMIVFSTVYSDADQRKHQSSLSLSFVKGIHRWPVTQRVISAENVSIWWRHHDTKTTQMNIEPRLGLNYDEMKMITSFKIFYHGLWLAGG